MSCTPMAAADPYCGFLAPLPSAFTASGNTSATAALNQFMPTLQICPNLNVTLAPLLYCFGSLGPCNGATWSLPSDPSKIEEDAAFFNNLKINDLSPALTKAGLKPLCYDACNAMAKPLVTCAALALIGVKSTSDPCAGLPNTNCISLPGDSKGNTLTWAATGGIPFVSAAGTPATTTPAATTTKSSAEKLMLGASLLAVIFML